MMSILSQFQTQDPLCSKHRSYIAALYSTFFQLARHAKMEELPAKIETSLKTKMSNSTVSTQNSYWPVNWICLKSGCPLQNPPAAGIRAGAN